MKFRKICLMALDIFVITFCYYLGFLLKFEWKIPTYYFDMYLKWIIPVVIIKISIFTLFSLYKTLWRYADFYELFKVILATITANAVSSIVLISMKVGFPRSILIFVFLMDMFFVTATRYLSKARKNLMFSVPNDDIKRTLIIGAGEAGVLVVNELRNHKELGYEPVVFIDDDKSKWGVEILGIPVVGGREKIIDAISEYRISEVILAMPSVERNVQENILDICSKLSMKIKIIPGMYELIEDSKLNVKDLRDVRIGDLLGRDEVKLNQEVLSEFLKDKVVLVTGGGGSIGSELCRQIVKFNPKKLIILDIYENNAYDIQMELLRHYKDVDLTVEIESIRDAVRMDIIIEKYKPNVVFHAAAHKHVPLMENSSTSAIKNNVFGTLNVIKACDKYEVERFVLISTDKAVNPTSVMGTTKRICEMLVQIYNAKSKTEFVAVRFGNVLGSNGSVIPLFIEQIKEGGPVTVTHEDIIRYFMTIPEACQLVLQAGAIAKGGEIFILDMGEPVKILDLAVNLIKMSGLEPYKDIDIKITGLRPGEKLYEEILLNMENSVATEYEKIFIEKPIIHNEELLFEGLEKLDKVKNTLEKKEITDILKDIVPTFKPDLNN
ncbi:MAG: nucleoside-diphosphate sugar epimerase/dehydratase [Parvimonas sp.]|uniref:polysaccharide biosynthesis protein n=1 Tax=Parvimonas sp. TaxID=1944660 RepID=UPI0025D77C4A|nr:nucleoside-diphosphate sugar epimerase/dehydratase [Parvimonas sp.]MCI5996614.1 polysaccharide biosynthesis protein [Parvimonas sp.]MDY3051344.1 nucleoside-diphosphate sugar epimerase/dehydratase [Parvimonas sp.]